MSNTRRNHQQPCPSLEHLVKRGIKSKKHLENLSGRKKSYKAGHRFIKSCKSVKLSNSKHNLVKKFQEIKTKDMLSEAK